MSNIIPPAPIDAQFGAYNWIDWYEKVRLAINNATNTIPVTQGGTGLTSYAIGDLVYASATNTLTRRAIGSTGQFIQVVGGLPTWSTLLGTANGGTGTASPALVAGTNITITGSWPNNTINASGGGSSVVTDVFGAVLSLQSGVPFPVTDTSAATTVYVVPVGGVVTLWDSVASAWTNYALTTQITTAIGTVGAAFTPEDWYLFQSSGTPTVERQPWRSDAVTMLVSAVTFTVAHNLNVGDPIVFSGGSLPGALTANTVYWVNATPTGTSINLATTFGGSLLAFAAGSGTAWHSRQRTSTTVTLQDGRYCKSTDKTRRYIGSVWYDSTTTTSDTQGGVTTQVGAKRYVYNYYHRRSLGMKVFDSTSFWAYVNPQLRSANNVFANRVEFFIGIQEQYVSAQTFGSIGVASNSVPGFSGVGMNTNLVFSGNWCTVFNGSASSIEIAAVGGDRQPAPLGYNFYCQIESGPTSGTGNWIGSLSSAKSGMQAMIEA